MAAGPRRTGSPRGRSEEGGRSRDRQAAG
jgi:hypothetical protein